MNPTDYMVTPGVGLYTVQRKGGEYATQTVTKDKHCSCGGNALDPCIHIEAVKAYLLRGGRKAKSFEKTPELEMEPRITECPICDAETEWAGSHAYPLMWRCVKDPSHFWEWYGETKVKRFFTEERASGIPAIDEMSTEEYSEYLDKLEDQGGSHAQL